MKLIVKQLLQNRILCRFTLIFLSIPVTLVQAKVTSDNSLSSIVQVDKNLSNKVDRKSYDTTALYWRKNSNLWWLALRV